MTFLCRILLLLCSVAPCSCACSGQTVADQLEEVAASPQVSNLPEWVERGTYIEGTDTLLVVRTKRPFHSPIQADEAIESAIRNAVQEYFTTTTGMLTQPIEISASEIDSILLVPGTRIVRQYDEVYSTELAARYGMDHGTFYRGFALLRLSESYVTQTIVQIRKQRVRERLKLAGAGGIGWLLLLAIVFVYFRVDHATRGFYSRRLQAVSVVAVLFVVLTVYWIMTH